MRLQPFSYSVVGHAGTVASAPHWHSIIREDQMQLRPCPICQSDGILIERVEGRAGYRVRCLNCSLSMEQGYAENDKERQPIRDLLNRWNQCGSNRSWVEDRVVKDCPFCGYDVPLIEQPARSELRIRCPRCSGSLDRKIRSRKNPSAALTELVRLWNQRTQEMPEWAGGLVRQGQEFRNTQLFVEVRATQKGMRCPERFIYGLVSQYGRVFSVQQDFPQSGEMPGFVVDMDPDGADRVWEAWRDGQVDELLHDVGLQITPWQEERANRDPHYALGLRQRQVGKQLKEATGDAERLSLQEELDRLGQEVETLDGEGFVRSLIADYGEDVFPDKD
jgi:hypothetical protein